MTREDVEDLVGVGVVVAAWPLRASSTTCMHALMAGLSVFALGDKRLDQAPIKGLSRNLCGSTSFEGMSPPYL